MGQILYRNVRGPGVPKGYAMAGIRRAFNPASIPGLTALYDWLSPAWQDSPGTIPVTTNGQYVAQWDDISGNGRNIIGGVGNELPIYRPAGGPAAGKYGLEWDGTNTQRTYNTAGDAILSGSAATLVAVVNISDTGAANYIAGHGGFNGNLGMMLQANASDRLEAIVSTTGQGGGAYTLLDAVTTLGDWLTLGVSYDGATMRFLVRGGIMDSVARTGPINFAGGDTAFGIGGSTGNGGGSAFMGPKTIGLILTTSTGYDAAGLAALLDQIAGYAALP